MQSRCQMSRAMGQALASLWVYTCSRQRAFSWVYTVVAFRTFQQIRSLDTKDPLCGGFEKNKNFVFASRCDVRWAWPSRRDDSGLPVLCVTWGWNSPTRTAPGGVLTGALRRGFPWRSCARRHAPRALEHVHQSRLHNLFTSRRRARRWRPPGHVPPAAAG